MTVLSKAGVTQSPTKSRTYPRAASASVAVAAAGATVLAGIGAQTAHADSTQGFGTIGASNITDPVQMQVNNAICTDSVSNSNQTINGGTTGQFVNIQFDVTCVPGQTENGGGYGVSGTTKGSKGGVASVVLTNAAAGDSDTVYIGNNVGNDVGDANNLYFISGSLSSTGESQDQKSTSYTWSGSSWYVNGTIENSKKNSSECPNGGGVAQCAPLAWYPQSDVQTDEAVTRTPYAAPNAIAFRKSGKLRVRIPGVITFRKINKTSLSRKARNKLKNPTADYRTKIVIRSQAGKKLKTYRVETMKRTRMNRPTNISTGTQFDRASSRRICAAVAAGKHVEATVHVFHNVFSGNRVFVSSVRKDLKLTNC